MLFPVRCFTCLKCIGGDYEKYVEEIKTKNNGVVLDELGHDRYCCRRMFLSYVDVVSEMLKYK